MFAICPLAFPDTHPATRMQVCMQTLSIRQGVVQKDLPTPKQTRSRALLQVPDSGHYLVLNSCGPSVLATPIDSFCPKLQTFVPSFKSCRTMGCKLAPFFTPPLPARTQPHCLTTDRAAAEKNIAVSMPLLRAQRLCSGLTLHQVLNSPGPLPENVKVGIGAAGGVDHQHSTRSRRDAGALCFTSFIPLALPARP